jgi:ankyrin repeat protein
MSAGPEEMREYLALERALRAGRLDQLPDSITTLPGFADVRDHYTGTPLICLAISWAPVTCVRELVSMGADVNARVDDGFPAVLGAVMSPRADRLELVEALAELGADLEQRGINNWTPLHAAASTNDAQMTELLLRLGADPTARTVIDDDATPLQEARRAGASDVVKILEAMDERTS